MKSIDPELRQLIHIYLVTEKVPHISGELCTVEQVRGAAEYIFKGGDPRFEIPGQASRLKDSTKVPQQFCTTDKTTKQGRIDQLLQAMPMLVADKVEKRLTAALSHILSPAPDLPPV